MRADYVIIESGGLPLPFSTARSMDDYGTMFHGDDERIDVESLRLSTQMWEALGRDLLQG